MRFTRKLVCVLVGITLLVSISATPLWAAEQSEPSPDEVAMDLLLVRPVALCSIVVGSAIFVVGLIFTIPTGNLALSGRKLVVEPVKFTFLKPLGALDTPFRLADTDD
jgi:hypothetical protein